MIPVLLTVPVWGAIVLAPFIYLLPAGAASSAAITLLTLFLPLFGALPIAQSGLAAPVAGLMMAGYYCAGVFAMFIVWASVLS